MSPSRSGRRPAALHNALAEALAFHEGIGVERKSARLRYLKERWAKRLQGQKGVHFYTSLDPAQSCAMALVGIEGIDPGKLTTHLWDKYRIIVVGIVHDEFKRIRVAPSTYTTIGEIDLFCEAMEKVIQNGI